MILIFFFNFQISQDAAHPSLTQKTSSGTRSTLFLKRPGRPRWPQPLHFKLMKFSAFELQFLVQRLPYIAGKHSSL